MLEIKHLTKIYKTKGGHGTKALDDVSINFEETGLVFLLGKSGSGKSTLLNLAGGLDAPTSGEIIVMGKSSRDFTGSDFDSYRNTFVGFIFQEYNVLNEFSVEDNVALALELQGKPKDRQKIAEILQSVELEQFAKRKPNTLSGGQKQRIAIARALVKDPQIIMADEPTGALDSATGRQVFETLKKLSANRLVIVVSHDREFAEIYGDRIVELADGKIISDVTKKKVTPKQLDENVTLIGENTLAVKSGSALTEANFLTIKKFLSESNGNVVLTKGEKEISDFKRAARMDDSGAREHFEDTDQASLNIKKYEKDETKFIRSRLPAAKALKIGASGLKLKPFRLVLTILLSFVAFVMFGLFSTMMVYDNDEVLTNTFMGSDYEYIALSKNYNMRATYQYGNEELYTYNYTRSANFTPAELEKFAAVTGGAFGAYNCNFGSPANVSVKTDLNSYYDPSIGKLTVCGDDHLFASKLTAGAFPKAKKEICVSSYFLDCMKNADFRVVDENGAINGAVTPTEIRSAEDLIGKYISFYQSVFRVSGVFDSGEIPAKYNDLKSGGGNYLTMGTYRSYLEQSPHTMAFVAQEYVNENLEQLTASNEYVEYFESTLKYIRLTEKGNSDPNNSFHIAHSLCKLSPATENVLPITFFGTEKTALEDNELIVPVEAVGNLVRDDSVFQQLRIIDTGFVAISKPDADGNEIIEERPATKAEITTATANVKAYFTENSDLLKINVFLDEYEHVGEMNIIGYYTRIDSYYQDGLYCGQDLYDRADVYKSFEKTETKYEHEDDAYYGTLFVPLVKDRATFASLLDLLGIDNGIAEKDVFYKMDNVLYESVELVNDIVDTLSTVFLVVGIVLAVFAALLLFNFISMSISNKKKEIGILRAVGARGLDVFKIFFSESGIIVGICTLLSLIGSIILTSVINNILKAEVGLDVTLFVFGWVSVAMMTGVALIVALASTFLPVYFASRKKPVESIRAL